MSTSNFQPEAPDTDELVAYLDGELTADERAAVEALARGVAAKLLHDPIVSLKERSEPGTEGVHARVLAELLGIDPDQP